MDYIKTKMKLFFCGEIVQKNLKFHILGTKCGTIYVGIFLVNLEL